MGDLLCVTWTVTTPDPLGPHPGVRRHCPRCDVQRTHLCSGRFRVNAQKKRIDVWLIYRCSTCSARWNRPIHVRASKAAIGAAALARLMGNEPEDVARHAGDLEALRRAGVELERQAPELKKTIDGDVPAAPRLVRIRIACPGTAGPRLDRLLAGGLALPRARIGRLAADGLLRLEPAPLRRPVRDGQLVWIDLACCGQAEAAHLLAHASDQSMKRALSSGGGTRHASRRPNSR